MSPSALQSFVDAAIATTGALVNKTRCGTKDCTYNNPSTGVDKCGGCGASMGG